MQLMGVQGNVFCKLQKWLQVVLLYLYVNIYILLWFLRWQKRWVTASSSLNLLYTARLHHEKHQHCFAVSILIEKYVILYILCIKSLHIYVYCGSTGNVISWLYISSSHIIMVYIYL